MKKKTRNIIIAVVSIIVLLSLSIIGIFVNTNKNTQLAKMDIEKRAFDTSSCPYNFKFKQVSLEESTTFLLDEDGYLYACGRNGMSSDSISTVPKKMSDTVMFSMISCPFALDKDGNIWKLSNGNMVKLTGGTVFKKISGSMRMGDVCLAIDSSNNMWGYGTNGYGTLGNGTTTNTTSFVQIKSGIKDISTSGYHSLAIDTSGNLWAWGYNVYGEVGNGTTSGNTSFGGSGSENNVQSIPVKIKSGISKIATGSLFSLAIDTSGNLWAWGDNSNGAVGSGGGNATVGTTVCQTVPVKIKEGIKEITAGSYHSMAIDTSGYLWTWGRNYNGQLGNGTDNDKNLPTKITTKNTITSISAGNGFSAILDSESDLWVCGGNFYGEFGNKRKEQVGYKATEFIQITATPSTYTVTLNPNGGKINSGNVTSYTQGTTTTLPTNVTKTGYTFGGWYSNSNFSGSRVTSISSTETGNKTYYAKWTANTYTVTLNANGGTINSGNVTSYTYGTSKTLPTNVTKTGYTFGGWYSNSNFSGSRVTSISSTETGNKTYYAKWTANTYTVTLNPNGGTINSGNVTSYTYGNTTTLPTSVTREGYTFGGWYNNSSLSGTAVTSISSTESGNKTYYAKWDVIKHIVTFKDGETVVKTEEVNHGAAATAPTLTKEGYTLGWDKAFSNITSDITVNIVWIPNTYIVTFKDGETVAKTEEVNHGAGATAPTLTKEGYVLRWDKTFNNVTSDLTVNAVWLKDTDKDGIPDIEDPETLVNYVVEHYKQNVAQNGYEAPERETKQGNLGTVVNAIPKTYAGFSENETSTDRIPSGTVVDDGSLTLKLYYDRNTYTVTLNPNGGTINSGNVTSYTYGTTTTLPTNVTKEGYTFGGWYDNAELTGNAVAQITASDLNNKTYYAKWNINVHTVTFKDGETVAKTEQVSHGAGATAPTLTKEGYVLRWDKTFNNVTSDLTVNAVWLKDTDKDGIPDIEDPETLVNYVIEHYKQNVAQNGYEEPERETKQGNLGTVVNAIPKTYAGFSENETSTDRIPSGTVVDDGSLTTLKLYYDRNTYTVALNPNGGTINSGNVTSYTYGTTTTLPTNVTKEGYTFGGWYDNENLTGNAVSQITASDLNNKTYYAKWNANGNTAYKVSHYKQTENGYTLAETQNLTGQTGANVTALPKTYEGYVENVAHEERIPSGIVLADGSLELKLYYDMLKYKVTFKDGETVAKTETVNHGRGATAPALTKEGYVLRWDKEFNNVTSDLTVNAVWLKDTDGDGIPDIEDPDTLVEYIVKHYKQKGNTNTYELAEEEKLQGQLGSVVNAIPKAYVGYAENTEAAERRPSGTITSDEKLELILLYYRLKYTVTFKDGDEIVSVVEVLHGETVTPPNLTKPGYTLSWDKALDNITGEQTINAVWTKIPEEQREYKVEHYVETKEGGYSLKETDKLVGDIGDVVLAVPKTYNEYELNEKHEGTIREGEIKEDSELVLKLYYKYKRFTVIFKDGNDIVKEEEVIYGGTATPPNLTKPGYILSWNKVLDDITKEQTITAVWTRDPNYKDPNDGKDEKPSILPKTGEETVTLGAIMGLLGIAVVYFVKYKF